MAWDNLPILMKIVAFWQIIGLMHIRTGHFLVISDTVICYIYDIVNHSFVGFVTSARDWLIGLWMGDDGISCQVRNGNGRSLLFSLLAFPGMTLCAGSSGWISPLLIVREDCRIWFCHAGPISDPVIWADAGVACDLKVFSPYQTLPNTSLFGFHREGEKKHILHPWVFVEFFLLFSCWIAAHDTAMMLGHDAIGNVWNILWIGIIWAMVQHRRRA